MADCLAHYEDYALQHGVHGDEYAGERFSNHVTRMHVSQVMRDQKQRYGGTVVGD